jgi:hypothetical protein
MPHSMGPLESGVKIVEGHAIPGDAKKNLWYPPMGGAVKRYKDKDGSWVSFRDPRYTNDPRFASRAR